jgi:hypothetical protein
MYYHIEVRHTYDKNMRGLKRMIFNEREAIREEIQELKEQNRRDYDLYFESRKYRNIRVEELLNRLRELDERDKEYMRQPQEVPVVIPESVPIVEEPKPKPEVKAGLSETKKEYVQENIQKELNKRRTKAKQIPIEKLETIIVERLRKNGDNKEVQVKELKRFAEVVFDTEWKNFNNPLKRITMKNKRIVNSRYGFYKYVPSP